MAKQQGTTTNSPPAGTEAAAAALVLGEQAGADPALVLEGSTLDQAGADAAAAGPQTGKADVVVEVPGPGAGALQVAERDAGFKTRPLDQEGRDPRARAPADTPFFRSAPGATGVTVEVPGSGLPQFLGGPQAARATVIDANRVGGRRLVTAATKILHDGRGYEAGDELPVDFASYTELVQIGAVVATRWDRLEPEDD